MRAENLTLVFVDIVGFTARTAAQTREENERMLRRFDTVVRPLVARFRGRVIKTLGDAFLLTFHSPTDALLCAAAVHDRLAETHAQADAAERFEVRAALNVGEVRVESGDVFGEPVNIAARIESLAGAGEIVFSEAVYLSMTRSEIPAEEIGYRELKGISEPVRLYRVPRASEVGGYRLGGAGIASDPGEPDSAAPGERGAVSLPFGGLGLARIDERREARGGGAWTPVAPAKQPWKGGAQARGRIFRPSSPCSR